MKSPLEQLTEDLHVELAKQLLERVRTGEATAADLGVARQFLKDNGIDTVIKGNRNLAKLADIVPFPEEPVRKTGN